MLETNESINPKKIWVDPALTVISKGNVQGGPTRGAETGGDIGPS
jgi:hypothetical protein